MADVFLSYRRTDASAVRPLAQALRAQGLEVWLDEAQIEDFASIQRGIEEGLRSSKALVVWYSVDYPDSLACQWELTHAFVAAQTEGDPRRRILVINPETDPRHIEPVELRDARYRSAPKTPDDLAAIAGSVAQQVRSIEKAFAEIIVGPKPRWSGSARGDGSNRFVGRLRELWAVHSGLWKSELPLTNHAETRPLVRLTGLAGVGKSLIAEVYGIRFGAAYPGGIYWLRAFGHDADQTRTVDERELSLKSQLFDFAQQAGISTPGLTVAQVRQQLGRALEAGEAYLWVVDDLPSAFSWSEAETWLAPSANGRTLITTRTASFDWAGTTVTIGELDEQAAVQLLTHARKPATEAEAEEARALVHELGFHALALELAAITVQRRGFAEFRASLARPGNDVLDFSAQLLAGQGQGLPHRERANLNLSTTLFQSIDELSDPGRDFLRLAAQLAAAPIARDLAVRSLATASSLDAVNQDDLADLAIAGVLTQSLAREPTPGSYLFHTLVSRAMRYRDTNLARSAELRSGAIKAVAEFLQDDRVLDLRRHGQLRELVEHARVLVGPRLGDKTQLSTQEGSILDSLYIYQFLRGDFDDAHRFAERLIENARNVLGEEHPYTLMFRAYLGQVLRAQGDLKGSLAVHEAVLAVRRRTLGERDASTLTSLSDTALTVYALGELSRARALQEQVWALRRELLGNEHLDTLTAANNLAITLSAQGEHARAIELGEFAMVGRRRKLGVDHPDTLQAGSNLAEFMRVAGRGSASSPAQEDVLQKRSAQLEETHPDNLTIMNNLAAQMFTQGDKSGAHALFERVLELRQRELGPEHPITLETMTTLAAVRIALDAREPARELLEQSLELCRRVLGPTHPQTFKAAYHLLIVLSRLENSSDRIRELLKNDLEALIDCQEADLPAELREARNRLLPGLLTARAKPRVNPEAKRKSWWRLK